MTQELVALTPECLDIANAYITYGSSKETANQLGVSEYEIVSLLERKDVQGYINSVYLDRGYRNRSKLGDVLDRMIDSKIAEAEDSEIWTSKDLLELLQFAHKMRMDELKATQAGSGDKGATVNIANFGPGNYSQLMERLLVNDSGT